MVLIKTRVDVKHVRLFLLVSRCPVLCDIDGESLAKLYQKLESPALAAACLLVTSYNSEVLQVRNNIL